MSDRLRHVWRFCGGVALGIGIWSMHFIAMLAFSLPTPLGYDFALTAWSLGLAIGASYLALYLTTRAQFMLWRLLAGGLMMGVGIAGMHYTGMAAAEFPAGTICGAANGLNAAWLATSVILFTFAILIVTLMVSRFDARTSILVGAVSRLNGQIVRLATTDTLTGLPNRSTLTDCIERAIQSARRQRSGFAILFMDLDGFKTINDSLGHSVGDEVLSAFAQRLLLCVRLSDTVAPLGGDEFVVLTENLSSRADVGALAEGVLDCMRRGMWTDAQLLQVMPSIGIVLYPDDGDTVDTLLLKHADAARCTKPSARAAAPIASSNAA
ncbi:MAG: diguanylate cyclase/phosphodiesterase (GGDEF & EAL domains) with PAS/PAC sensor(s) [uncultured Paraburkholderia sp.]|nr:MAG: diguanylate cyclase/phosphodiesterase (GGDEF & EAL domains) with PAS/PAC sensor(s) [uncultured Paraburkholderia sp.]CAH2919804.1 MAG: diguanylate cyclase/phosphodiesterase (GGDEF & EAL domains) with PAS/PAC sensor(s) [uncultured Paraburkholderia sp.]